MKKGKSESRTLLWSVIMSSPGPLVVGLGLIAGRSSTQLADFGESAAFDPDIAWAAPAFTGRLGGVLLFLAARSFQPVTALSLPAGEKHFPVMARILYYIGDGGKCQ